MRVGFLVLCCILLAGTAHGALCALRPVAQVWLRDTDGFLTVPVEFGQTVSMLVDTGSDAGIASPGLAAGWRRLGGDAAAVSGTGGVTRRVPIAVAPVLGLGGFRLGRVPFPVGVLPQAPRIEPPVEGLIGADLLSRFELEMDVPDGVLRLFEGDGLSPLCRGLPPWAGDYETVPLVRSGDRVSLTVMLDGRPVTALLDSGARSRIVSRRAALAAGVAAGTLDAEAGGITSGIDGRDVIYHWHAFRSLRVGDEVVSDPVLTVTALPAGVDMLLGADWFAVHRVWVSYGTGEVFFQKARGSAPGPRQEAAPPGPARLQ